VLKIGSRALDILITLLEHAPETVSKRDLTQRAWGKLVVDEGSLRVHVAALRRQLGNGDSSANYITNVPGRGYCFTREVTWTAAEARVRKAPAAAPQLPRQPLLMVGRDIAVNELTARLKRDRFVSIVGPGGIGKTTVALALAHRMLDEFRGAVHFIELAILEDPHLVASTLASQLGLVAVSEQPLPVILQFLRERRVLLVFDSCEHVIDAVAPLAENIFRDAPEVSILVTSREALRAEGEQVHHLPPLESPPAHVESLTAAQALGFPAVELFVRQVANSGHPFELSDADAPIVAQICRRLDGIALALELAAARVGVYGVQGTASLLDKHFRLLWRGRRTALARHQTLSAALDWSYNLLSTTERQVLRRLAIFVGDFPLAAALEVASEELDTAELTETIATLVDKSLVSSDSTTAARYRLPETTRTYAWQKLIESGEHQMVARRHCEQLIRTLEGIAVEVWAAANRDSINVFISSLNNIRAALDWCVSDSGDTALGVRLSGASASLMFHAGLLPECVTWTERALGVLDTSNRGTPLELELLGGLSQSLMITRGNDPATRAVIVRALDITERLKVAPMELYCLHTLCKWQVRSGDFRGYRELAARVYTVAKQIEDPAAEAIAHACIAWKCFFAAENREVQRHVDIAQSGDVLLSKLNESSFGHRFGSKAISARNLWVLGYADQALVTALETVREAEELNHPYILCYAIMSSVIVPLETGCWERADELIRRLSNIATKHRLLSYARACVGWEGCLALARGDLPHGIRLLQTAIAALREDGYELYRPQFGGSLAEGLARAGRWEDAYNTICEEVIWADNRAHVLSLIDLMRVKGEIRAGMSPQNASEGETYLRQAFEVARQRELLSLELRCGTSLARLWAGRGEVGKARDCLEPIFNRFSEGFDTRDLQVATKLLEELRARC
jgi:predicted ATPase